MSEKTGRFITCDRCHEKTVFLEIRPVYEALPKDWLYIQGMGHMCPICARSFTEYLKTFFGEEGYERLSPCFKFIEEVEKDA